MYVTETQSKVLSLCRESKRVHEIAKELRVTESTVSYHIGRLIAAGHDIERFKPTACEADWEAIQSELDAGTTLKEIADQYGITKSALQWAAKAGTIAYNPIHSAGMTAAEYATAFGGKITVTAFRRGMVRRLIEENGGAQCKNCGLAEWLGKPLPVELDHADGDTDNNAPSNLRMLCHNCHAQTPTFRGRNIKLKRARLSLSCSSN
ncbi:helix-turn-helix domain-containing protein [Bradyrhizobium barranii subsp. barranii]|uniref:Helix-turn-helix domain-containing protein n=1 Tax=Bradyrhizobium barranii subsp. barranii TaxID=2823807 RepID=A0A939M891_9BRAD|nr:helix-turn-helix domain-containing protein [Bradyrhizobium barranii]UEM08572.1 helix-turn-helix domain-containing protein [Bradyrhizobium barranii subsp. barranii]